MPRLRRYSRRCNRCSMASSYECVAMTGRVAILHDIGDEVKVSELELDDATFMRDQLSRAIRLAEYRLSKTLSKRESAKD